MGLFFSDLAGVNLLKVEDSTSPNYRGLKIIGHAFIGRGSNLGPQELNVSSALDVVEQSAVNPDLVRALNSRPVFNSDLQANGREGALDDVSLNIGFDPDAVGGTSGVPLRGHVVQMSAHVEGGPTLVGSANTIGYSVKHDITIPTGSPTWSNLVGYDTESIMQVLNGAGASAVARSYGMRIRTAGNGASAWAASFNGMVQLVDTKKLGLGRGQTVIPTNSLRSKSATGQIVVMELNSVDQYEWDVTAFYPLTNGGPALGKDGNGWLDLWLKDTSAAFEARVVFTSSTALTADRTLSIDLVNGGRALKIQGNSTLDDWFDQSLKQGASPTFAALTISDGGNLVVGSATGTKIGTATTQKLGFFNAAPIARPSSSGETAGFTQNAGTAVLHDSAFTGNVGSTGYTIGDIVKHMKNLGLVAA